MQQGRATSWAHFYEDVTSRETWPRELWTLAVGDALERELSETSPLVVEFKDAVRELEAIEQRGRTTYRDERRAGELELRLQALLREADAAIRAKNGLDPARGSSGDPAQDLSSETADEARSELEQPGVTMEATTSSETSGTRARLGPAAIGGGAAVCGLLLGAGMMALLDPGDRRIDKRIEQALESRLAGTERAIADVEERLEARVADVGAERATTAAIQKDLEARASQIRTMVERSIAQIQEVSQASIEDLERRLDLRNDEVRQSVARLNERSAALSRGLDEVSADLAGIEGSLPGVQGRLLALDQSVRQGEEGIKLVSAEIEALKGLGLEMVAGAEEERAALELQMLSQQKELEALDRQIVALKGAVESAMERTRGFNQTMEETIADAEARADDLEVMTRAFDANRAEMKEVLDRTRRETRGLHADAASRLDTMLSKTAERADLAVLRSEDVLRRAETQALRRIEASGDDAIDALANARVERLADLSDEVQATRVEIEQTRAGLIASWQRMDALVAERHDELLAELDEYEQAMERRLRDLRQDGIGPGLQRASSESASQ